MVKSPPYPPSSSKDRLISVVGAWHYRRGSFFHAGQVLRRGLHAVTVGLFRHASGFLLVVGLILVLFQVAEAGACVGEVRAVVDVDVAVGVQGLQGGAPVVPVLCVKDMLPSWCCLLVVRPCSLSKGQLRRGNVLLSHFLV